MSMQALADQIIDAMRGYVSRSLAGIVARLEAVEARQPERGEKGEPGPAGKDADIEPLRAELREFMAAQPVPRDGVDGEPGRDGKDADEDAIERAVMDRVLAALDEIPRPKDGIDGRDGKDADEDAITARVTERALAAIESWPRPKDGEDGLPGRDALQLDVQPGIDERRSYLRGTFASHRGGLVRAYRNSDPLDECDGDIERAGWSVVVNGIDDWAIEQQDERRFVVALRGTDGRTVQKDVSLPVVLDRGVWREGTVYARGDAVTWGGSLWIAQADEAIGKPGDNNDFRLAVKRGRDGRDGEKGERGEKGRDAPFNGAARP